MTTQRLAIAVAALLTALPARALSGADPAPAAALEALTLRAALSHTGYTRSQPRQLLLKVEYTASAIDVVPSSRAPLNVALVLDRSASMKEAGKWSHAVEAARWVVENMTERDVLSLVVFGERTVVLSPAGRVVNKAFLFHRLDEVQPEGYTDLSGGLLEGLAQVNGAAAEGQVRHVLVLTDGLANRGILSVDTLADIARRAKAKGVGVSTLGCGAEFNEQLLERMADAGGGRYTYVKDAEQLLGAFREELQGMVRVAAQNVVLEVSVEGGVIAGADGEKLQKPVPRRRTEIGNLRAGERGVLFFGIEPGSFEPGSRLRAEARLVFDDTRVAERTTRAASAVADFAADPATVTQDEGIVLHWQLIAATAKAEDAAMDLDRRGYREAQSAFASLYDRAREHAIRQRDQELLNEAFILKHLMEELEAADREGALHDHREGDVAKHAHYRRYLRTHHHARPMDP